MDGFSDESDGGTIVLHGRPFDVGEFIDTIDRDLAVLNLIKQRRVGECNMESMHFPVIR